jgi:hypothetical protein
MNKLPKGKTAIWLDEFEMEVLGCFIAELLDGKNLDNTWQIAILENVYKQTQEKEKGK